MVPMESSPGTPGATFAQHPSRAVRSLAREVALSFGGEAPAEGAMYAELHAEVVRRRIDRIVFDGDCDECLWLCGEIRSGRLGSNPFAGLIAVLSSSDEARVRRTIDAGVDSVLLLPFSKEAASVRFAALRKKRPFVVSGGYVGPDRRKEARTGGVFLMEAPDPSRPDEEIQAASKVLEVRLRRALAERFVHALVEAASRRASGEEIEPELKIDVKRCRDRLAAHAPSSPPSAFSNLLDRSSDLHRLFSSEAAGFGIVLEEARRFARWASESCGA